MMLKTQLLSKRLEQTHKPYIDINAAAEKELKAVLQKIKNEEYKFEPHACSICGENDFLVIAEGERYGLPIKKAICTSCGLVQSNPDMRNEDYADFYKNHYRVLYFGDLVGTPADLFQQQIWKGQAIRDFIQKYAKLKSNSVILEVGCGAGGILEVFKRQGHRVICVDYGAVNLAFAAEHGVEVHEGSLGSIELPEKVDLIIYSHVMEHIKELHTELDIVHSLLADDGLLYIEVPGMLNVRWNTYQADLLKAFHIGHIYDFSLGTLQNLTGRHGFELIHGNEYIRSVYKKSTHAGSADNEFDKVMNYLVFTEKFHSILGRLARIRLKTISLFKSIKSFVVNTLKALKIFPFLESLFGRNK